MSKDSPSTCAPNEPPFGRVGVVDRDALALVDPDDERLDRVGAQADRHLLGGFLGADRGDLARQYVHHALGVVIAEAVQRDVDVDRLNVVGAQRRPDRARAIGRRGACCRRRQHRSAGDGRRGEDGRDAGGHDPPSRTASAGCPDLPDRPGRGRDQHRDGHRHHGVADDRQQLRRGTAAAEHRPQRGGDRDGERGGARDERDARGRREASRPVGVAHAAGDDQRRIHRGEHQRQGGADVGERGDQARTGDGPDRR